MTAAQRPGGRTGFTTGACATAAAKAALLDLLGATADDAVVIELPTGAAARFAVARRERGEGWALAAVVKDAGDDPDVTHGAEVWCRVELEAAGGVTLAAGEGVGTVTLPGLGLEVGAPAINSVPRRMITGHCAAALAERAPGRGCRVTVGVTGGRELAAKTLNPRLGIQGGLSILGRTGVVHPYSHAAWAAAVRQAVQVARAQDVAELALCTGGQTEEYAMALLPGRPALAFVQMGDCVGQALDACADAGVEAALLVLQPGKAAKLGQGLMQTHASEGSVDAAWLAGLAFEAGATAAETLEVSGANTARHAFELAQARPWGAQFGRLLAGRAAAAARERARGRLVVEVWLLDFSGAVAAKA